MAEKTNMDKLPQKLEGTMPEKSNINELKQQLKGTVPEKPNIDELQQKLESTMLEKPNMAELQQKLEGTMSEKPHVDELQQKSEGPHVDELQQKSEGTVPKKPNLDELQEKMEYTLPEEPNMDKFQDKWEDTVSEESSTEESNTDESSTDELQKKLEAMVPEEFTMDEFKAAWAKQGVDLDKTLGYLDQVGKFVKVKVANSEEHQGWLKCVDPMTGNFFLITLDDTITQVIGITLIMRDACRSTEVLKEPTERVTALLANMDNSIEGISAALIPDRKQRLLAWIKKNRLPVEEREDKTLVICNNVTVSPPYEIENCDSPNPRTLKSIQHLVAQLPSSIDEEAARLAKQKEKEKSQSLQQEN